ncbi:hypothetical protein [Shewanella colwelliana]|uniref:hypothetical protein n=1 Tax=Shewanella colwelliana TaxID=23 RepID=UPI0037366D4C
MLKVSNFIVIILCLEGYGIKLVSNFIVTFFFLGLIGTQLYTREKFQTLMSSDISNDGQKHLLVKGGTQKVQRSTTTMDETSTTTIKIDQFVPTIRAIDITTGDTFGDIVVIQ